jgi:ribonuclease VapC
VDLPHSSQKEGLSGPPRQAYRDFGKTSGHPAKLNLGDCFSYALAKSKAEPLLFKGQDFSRTDVKSARA